MIKIIPTKNNFKVKIIPTKNNFKVKIIPTKNNFKVKIIPTKNNFKVKIILTKNNFKIKKRDRFGRNLKNIYKNQTTSSFAIHSSYQSEMVNKLSVTFV